MTNKIFLKSRALNKILWSKYAAVHKNDDISQTSWVYPWSAKLSIWKLICVIHQSYETEEKNHMMT